MSRTEMLESASVLGPWERVMGVISTERHVTCSGSGSRTGSAALAKRQRCAGLDVLIWAIELCLFLL